MDPIKALAEYRGLQKYLDNRFANTVVMRFQEIEDLLGFALPDSARRQQEWWANPGAETTPSVQSRSWIQSGRTATANLVAQTVIFDRASA